MAALEESLAAVKAEESRRRRSGAEATLEAASKPKRRALAIAKQGKGSK